MRIKEHTLSAEFARLFHAHPASIEDPGLALQSARETLSERHPGDEYETDDETLSVYVERGVPEADDTEEFVALESSRAMQFGRAW